MEIQELSASWGHGGVEREEMWSCAELHFCMSFTPRTTQRMLRTQGNACTTVKAGAVFCMDRQNVPAFLEVIFNHLWLCMVHYKHQSFSISAVKSICLPEIKYKSFFFIGGSQLLLTQKSGMYCVCRSLGVSMHCRHWPTITANNQIDIQA